MKTELEVRLWQQRHCKWWPIEYRLTNYKRIKQLQKGELQPLETINYRDGKQLSLFKITNTCIDTNNQE